MTDPQEPPAVSWPLEPVDPRHFVGGGRVARLGASADQRSLKLFHVEFEPGARTHWHLHTGTQILLVQHGRCRFQREGHPAVDLGPGDTVTIPPGERHWHGAAPGSATAHLAVNLHAGTEWMEPVTEDQYHGSGGGAAGADDGTPPASSFPVESNVDPATGGRG